MTIVELGMAKKTSWTDRLDAVIVERHGKGVAAWASPCPKCKSVESGDATGKVVWCDCESQTTIRSSSS